MSLLTSNDPPPVWEPPPGQTIFPAYQVRNQPPAHDPRLWDGDPVLRAGLSGRYLDQPLDLAPVAAYAAALEGAERREAARAANRHPPHLRIFDAGGRRLDDVCYHPAYHDFLRLGLTHGYSAGPWEPGGRHAAHAGMVYLHSQVEPGTCCPLTMTYAAAAVPGLPEIWRHGIGQRAYDPAIRPAAAKAGLTLGMTLTELQAGSDLRQTATRAEETADGWRITGHKWFCSAPMSDGFLTLAQTEAGLSAFLVPRWLEGARNGLRLQRLKDKLGNRSNGSAELEFDAALALPVGEPGEGIRAILPMVHHTRLDTAMAPAGLMRAALGEAWHWCRNRSVFQRHLSDQPLMRAVIADLALDWEASVALGLRVAHAFDSNRACQRALARIGVAIAKFHNTKLCVPVVAEAMEVMGGLGYVEDTVLPLLYREAPLNAIWEGSGNVICLDALRTLARDPLAGESLRWELTQAKGVDRRYDTALSEHEALWPGLPEEAGARWYVERLGVLLAASLLLRQGPPAVADAYVATRVLDERGRMAGSIGTVDVAGILARLGED